jgi:hypothetical protein
MDRRPIMRSAKYVLASAALLAPLALPASAQASNSYCSVVASVTGFTVDSGDIMWVAYDGSHAVTGALYNKNDSTNSGNFISMATQDVGAVMWVGIANGYDDNLPVDGWTVLTYEC